MEQRTFRSVFPTPLEGFGKNLGLALGRETRGDLAGLGAAGLTAACSQSLRLVRNTDRASPTLDQCRCLAGSCITFASYDIIDT